MALIKQECFDTDPKRIELINFIGTPDYVTGTTVFFILKES